MSDQYQECKLRNDRIWEGALNGIERKEKRDKDQVDFVPHYYDDDKLATEALHLITDISIDIAESLDALARTHGGKGIR